MARPHDSLKKKKKKKKIDEGGKKFARETTRNAFKFWIKIFIKICI